MMLYLKSKNIFSKNIVALLWLWQHSRSSTIILPFIKIFSHSILINDWMAWKLMSCCRGTAISNRLASMFHNWTWELCYESICLWAGETALYFFHVTLDSICFMHVNSFSLRKKSCQSESTTEADRISMFIYACFRTSSASFQSPLHMHELLLKTSILIEFLG